MTENTNYIGTVDPGLIQFENANEGRSYPFDDNVILETVDGIKLEDSIISDLHLVVPCGQDAYLSSIYVSENMISVCLKMFCGTLFKTALSVFVKRESFEPYIPYRMEKLTGSEDVGGIISFGDNPFREHPSTYRFYDRKIRIVDSAVSRYVPAALRTLIDDRTGESVRGDVSLSFSNYILSYRDGNALSLKLKDGAAKVLASSCDKDRPVNPCGATPVMSINNVKPDDEDRIVIWFH